MLYMLSINFDCEKQKNITDKNKKICDLLVYRNYIMASFMHKCKEFLNRSIVGIGELCVVTIPFYLRWTNIALYLYILNQNQH